MSGPIQRIPPGFLGFLQLKNFGKNPSELPDVLTPTLGMFDWYMQANAESRFSSWSLATNATGPVIIGSFANTNLLVPNTEIWFVIAANVGLQTLPAANDTCSLKLGYFDRNLGGFFGAPGPDEQCLLVGGTSDVRPFFRSHNFWVPPGGYISAWVEQATFAGGPFTASLGARVVRMPL